MDIDWRKVVDDLDTRSAMCLEYKGALVPPEARQAALNVNAVVHLVFAGFARAIEAGLPKEEG